MIWGKNAPIGLGVDRSAEVVQNSTDAKSGNGHTPKPEHAVEEVLLKMIIFFPIYGPRNNEARKNEENDNIILPILRAHSVSVPGKEPIKIGMT